MHGNVPDRKVLVVQRGARHRYAIPRLLEDEGMLAALYTNSCAFSLFGRVATGLGRLGVRSSALHALAARIPNGVSKSKIRTSDRELVAGLFKVSVQQGLGAVYRRWGLRGATVVYSMYGENLDFLQWAKGLGAKIMIDVFVHPETNRIVAAEEARVNGIPMTTWDENEDTHSRNVFALADRLLCPSEWVASGVRNFSPEHAHKIKVLPYGSSVAVSDKINTPEAGRILFAGREPLRKGLHHLAEAAWLLRQNGLNVDVRVAGVAQEDIRWMKHAGELTCLGTIPMAQMKDEYAKAAVFVLPSLSEGQAGVLLEAMACGCAVVATKESGVDFEPGCGVTVPVGDPETLAGELKKILVDESYRNELAAGALQQATQFSMDAWKLRLVKSVEGVFDAE